jgi:hypothetical protein
MKVLRVMGLVVALSFGLTRQAEAYPMLQLDIIGGHYDTATQTIVSNGPDFTLVALLTPRPGKDLAELLGATYFIAAAVSPGAGPTHSSLGSFTWDGTNYDVTEDMIYGVPPLEDGGVATHDPGDLGAHSIFPTFFNEFSFQFSANNRTIAYDSAADPGGLMPTSNTTGIGYYATFNLTTTFNNPNVLHFDLYNSYLQACSKNRSCALDEDIGLFAPFSHDAQSSNRVPEPVSLLTLSVGLMVAGGVLSRKRAAR